MNVLHTKTKFDMRRSGFLVRKDWKCLADAYRVAGGSTRTSMWIAKAGSAYARYLQHLRKHHGVKVMFTVLKQVELIVEDIVVNRADGPSRPFPFFTKRDSRWGMPSRLYPLRVLAGMRSKAAKSFALSIASTFRALNVTLPRDKFPTAELSWSDWKIDSSLFEEGLNRVHRRSGGIRPRHTLPPRDYWRASASVFYPEAVFGAAHDARVLLENDEVLVTLRELWLSSIPGSTSQEWEDWLVWLERLAAMAPRRRPRRKNFCPENTLSRFAWVPDRGGKLRGVTPTNYHVQSVLRPIHDFLMHCLERLPTDCSYDEQKAHVFVSECTLERDPRKGGCSTDIPDATTQFPAQLVARAAAKFLGPSTEFPFYRMMRLPVWFGPGIGKRPFSKGAPMGLYCLWPAFTLAHHSIVQGCAAKAARALRWNGWWYTRYRIRGDDNFIADRAVATRYIRVWTDLGQEPGPEKSVFPWIAGVVWAKFAKRVFVRGNVLRPFTYGEVVAARHFAPTAAFDFIAPMVEWCRLSREEPLCLPAFLSAFLGESSGRARSRLSQALRALRVLRFAHAITAWGATVDMGIDAPSEINAMAIRAALNQTVKDRVLRLIKEIWTDAFPDAPLPPPVENAPPPEHGRLPDRRPQLRAVLGSHVSRGALTSPGVLEDHPVLLRLHRLADEIQNAEEFVTMSRSVFEGSKAIRVVSELQGISEALRRANRRATRLAILSRLDRDAELLFNFVVPRTRPEGWKMTHWSMR